MPLCFGAKSGMENLRGSSACRGVWNVREQTGECWRRKMSGVGGSCHGLGEGEWSRELRHMGHEVGELWI